MTIIRHSDKLLRTTEIQDKVVDASTVFDDQIKQGLKNISKHIRDFLRTNVKANSYQIQSLTNEILTYWNETISPNTEIFWAEMRANHIDFERKEPLRFALNKNHFRNVEQGIDAKNNWEELKKLHYIIDNYTPVEIEKIDKIIAEDEDYRLSILKKCLTKKSIPKTLYLKFGECMAYFGRCRLFEKYFTEEQVEDLYIIWKNFESE